MAAFLLLAAPAHAQTVSKIVVQGNQRVEAETIAAYVTLKPGQPYSAAKQDESLKALFNTGLFADVHIDYAGGPVIVRVVENPIIDRVAFEGNKKLDKDQLSKEIESQPRGTYTRAKVQSDVQRIIDVYRRQGRFDISVVPKIIDLPDNRVNLVFEINEGEKTKVEKISFIGNRAFSDRTLRDVITTTETNWLSFLKSTDIYDPERLAVDQELLRRFYLKKGYADFRVISAVADYDRDRNAFFITITVEEGDLYTFGTVDIESHVAAVDAETLRPLIRSKSGEVYNAELIDKSLEDLNIETAKRGYPFAQVRPRGDRDPANHVVNVAYMVEEGPRVYVERINIVNNTRTMDKVIRREFDIAEGDAFNRVLLDRGEKRLNKLGYFKKVTVTREPGSTADRVIVNVKVDEQSTGEISFGAGYATNDGFIGDIGISEKNFLGRGQYVKTALTFGEHRQAVDLSFTEPYFMDRRLAAGVDLFYRKTSSSTVSSFDQSIIGAGVRLGVTLMEDLTFQARLRGYQQEINVPLALQDCAPGAPPADPCFANGEASLAIKAAQGTAFVTVVGDSLVYNKLDNNRNPHSGYLAEVNVDYGHVSPDSTINPFTGTANPDSDFIRTTGEVRGYYPISDDLVAMLRLQGGNIFAVTGTDVRLVDSFFKGGEFIRGFETGGIGPRDVTTTRFDALGGTTYFGGTAELQFPIPGLPDDVGIKGALFADAGTLYNVGDLTGTPYNRCPKGSFTPVVPQPSGCSFFDDASIRSSVGLSILWQSPMGPIRFDFGFPVSKEPYDKVQNFRFSGGTTF